MSSEANQEASVDTNGVERFTIGGVPVCVPGIAGLAWGEIPMATRCIVEKRYIDTMSRVRVDADRLAQRVREFKEEIEELTAERDHLKRELDRARAANNAPPRNGPSLQDSCVVVGGKRHWFKRLMIVAVDASDPEGC